MIEQNKKIHIAQIICQCVNGGVESCIMNYYRHIDRSRVQFDFFVDNESEIINKKEVEALGGRVIIVPPYKHLFKFIKFLKTNLRGYDIVHSNINVLSFFSLMAAKKAGVKIRIAHSHSTTNKKEKAKNFAKNILKYFSKIYATHYFACSELAGKWLFGNKAYMQNKIKIIHNAVDIEKFGFDLSIRNQVRSKLNLSDENIVVGHIGRFVKQKNQEYMLKIFSQLVKINHNYRLLVIGDGPLKKELNDVINELALNNYIIMTGVVANPDIYYNSMDCFLLPSLYEGLPIVGVEAQINGLSCFFSDTITKEIKINENAYFYSIDIDASEWANKINSNLICNSLEYNRILSRVENCMYDIRNVSRDLLDEYFLLLKENEETR